MQPKKILLVVIITLFLSLFLQSLVDVNVFVPSNWRQNTWVNLLHFWLTFVSSYYLFSYVIQVWYRKLSELSSKKVLFLLAITQTIVMLWIFITDILFYFWYYKVDSLKETTFYEFDVPLVIAITTIGSIYFYQQYHTKPVNSVKERNALSSKELKKIPAYAGKEHHFIDQDEIGVFYLADGIVWVELLNGNLFHTDYSLTKLLDVLNAEHYFRLNRQVIISKKAIKGFDKLSYQKLKVILIETLRFDENLIVSKYNAPAFKKWLTNSGIN
ncbi:MAG: LytTR family DNA-binding domain-containing protein [Bacteroidota bacterium]